MSITSTEQRTALYRFFDTSGTLLYVGITNRFGTRWSNHARKKPWWPEVHSHTAEWFVTRDEAKEAEKTAIRKERPKHNIVHRPKPPRLRRARPQPTPEGKHTKPRQCRIADGAWETYADICKRLGRTRADDLNAHIRDAIKQHGTPEEIARLADVDAELEARRARQISGLRSQRHKKTAPEGGE